MKQPKWHPPFKVLVCRQDGSQKTLAEGANYPEAIQLRFAWRHELESKGYKARFGSNRMAKEAAWEECHISDSKGKAI